MYKQYYLNKMVGSELGRYEKLYTKLEARLRVLPKGTLSIKRGKPYCQMRINGKQYTTLIVNDDKLVYELKERRYIKKCIPILKKKIELYRMFLEQDLIYNPNEIEKQLPKQYNGVDEFGVFLDGKINLDEWLKSGNKNTAPFVEVHHTYKGLQCRSKSEALIGSCLEYRGILYIYEPEIRIRNKKLYPDFAIYLPKSGRIIYFEHFGKIDDPKYSIQNFPRFAEYAEAGIYVGINLFYTTEAMGKPLTMNVVNKIIDKILALDEEY